MALGLRITRSQELGYQTLVCVCVYENKTLRHFPPALSIPLESLLLSTTIFFLWPPPLSMAKMSVRPPLSLVPAPSRLDTKCLVGAPPNHLVSTILVGPIR